jgi:hypothetical protein
MIGTVFANIARFVLLILIQVLVLDHLDVANGYMVPYLYVLFLLMLPIELPAWAQLTSGAIVGLVMDVFSNTPGMHMSACVVMMYARLNLLRLLAPREGYEFGTRPTVPRMGTRLVPHVRWTLDPHPSLVVVLHRDPSLRSLLRYVLSRHPQRDLHAGLVPAGAIPHLSPRARSSMNTESRKYVLIAAVLFISSVFLMRLFWIQVVDGKWKAEAANMAERKVTIYPSRGLIYDRKERLLVANTPVYDLMVVPKEVEPFDTSALCRLISVPEPELRARLAAATAYSKYKPSVIEKQIPADQFAAISVHLHKYPGFFGQSRTLRTYPPHVAAHLLGYLSEVNARKVEQDPYYKSGDVIGVGGLESYYEKEMRGRRGVSYVLVDVHNNQKGSFKNGQYDTLAVEGKDLFTGIDLDMQRLGEQLMVNKKGSIVALDPRTGEVLCLVSSPSYDPELLVGRVRNTNYGVLQRDPIKPLFDRALQAQYPPGSIFKIVQSLIALDEGVITVNTGFPCNKSLVGCHNHPSAGTIEQAIQMSCNPYFYMVFKRLIEQDKDPSRFKDAAIGLAEWHSTCSASALVNAYRSTYHRQRVVTSRMWPITTASTVS